MKLDAIDHKIIKALESDGRQAVSELAKRIGLSATPCRLRIERLQREGYILGYQAIVNHAKLGREQVCFVEVKLDKTDQKTIEKFNDAAANISEIEEIHMIAGSYDYLLKVRAQSIEDFRYILGEVISSLPSVQFTTTNVAMQSIKETGLYTNLNHRKERSK